MRLPFALCALLLALSLSPVQAAPNYPIPTSMYPPGTKLSYIPSVTNADWSCNWAFVCDGGTPVSFRFHGDTADNFHRTGGWVQIGVHAWPGKSADGNALETDFELVFNTFDTTGPDPTSQLPYDEVAFADFGATLKGGLGFHRYKAAASVSLVPQSHDGKTAFWTVKTGGLIALAAAVWVDNGMEVEAIAVCNDMKGREAKMWHWFKEQLAASLIAPASSGTTTNSSPEPTATSSPDPTTTSSPEPTATSSPAPTVTPTP